MSKCQVKDSIYYQIARFAIYNQHDRLCKYSAKKSPLCKYFITNSDMLGLSEKGFSASAFLVNKKLIFGFAGTMFDSFANGMHDLHNSANIIFGLTPTQQSYAEEFRGLVKIALPLGAKYDKEIGVGMSLGGSLAELVHKTSPFNFVYSFDGIGTKGLISNPTHHCDILLIRASENIINKAAEQAVGYIATTNNPNYQQYEQSNLKRIDVFTFGMFNLVSHDPKVLGTGMISEKNIEAIGECSGYRIAEITKDFCDLA